MYFQGKYAFDFLDKVELICVSIVKGESDVGIFD